MRDTKTTVAVQGARESSQELSVLKRQLENYRRAQAMAHVGSWELNLRDHDLWCSEEFYRIFGLAPTGDEAVFERFLAYVHPDDRLTVTGAMEESMRTGASYRLEHRIVWPDGKVRIVCGKAAVELDEAGKALCMRGTLQDVTERRQAEDAVGLADQVFRHAIEGIMVTDAAGVIQSVNQAFTDITGYPSAEAVGRKPNFLRSERHDQNFYRELWRVLLEHDLWEGEIWNRRRNGEIYAEKLTITAVRDTHGQVNRYIGIFHDITEIKHKEEQLAFHENHDALTGLVNRTLFTDLLGQALGYAQRDGNRAAVLLLGLDRFRHINETFGHPAGDDLLFNTAWRLAATVNESDTIARFGGDTFAILSPSLASGSQEALNLAQRLARALAEPFEVEAQKIYLTASIGIAVYPSDGIDAAQLIRNAEVAMNRAKDKGRDGYQFYTEGMNEQAATRVSLEAAMRRGLENDEFQVYYQPKYGLAEGRIVGMEALVRWRHPERGMVSPVQFIPLAEESGLIVELGEWILRESCRQLRQWQAEGHDLTVAVNLSARQFKQPNLMIVLEDILKGAGLAPSKLELEVTESAMMADVDKAIATLQHMRDLGLGVAMDDFGTGYSSLSYLKRFPISKLKIDQSFVREMHNNPADVAIVDAVLTLSRSLGIKVVAEGVEDARHVEMLRARGCDEYQGYYFSRPLSADQFSLFLQAHREAMAAA